MLCWCDLSYQCWGQDALASGVHVSALEQLQGNILTDNKGNAWQCLVVRGKGTTVNIVMDNSDLI